MATITLKGYVNQPSTKDSSKGKFSVFTIGEKGKTKDGTPKRTFFNITNFHSPEPPPESAYVTVTGRLNVREYTTSAGLVKQSLDIYADSVEIAPPLEGAKATAQSPDNWDF